MRYSLPCKVDEQGAWDAELDLADSANYVTEKVLENIGFVRVNLSDYGREMVNDVDVEIHGVKFKVDFVVLEYVNEGEPSILFGRDFLATTKSQVDFGLGEIRMNLTKFKEGIDDLTEEVGSSSGEVVKMGKANYNKGYNINKLTPPPSLRLEEIPPTSTIPPQPIYHPLTAKQKEKMKEVLDIKYKELEESKPILKVLKNYVIYKKKLDEILIGKEILNKKEFSEEDKVGIIEHGLPKKLCDLGNYVLPIKINGVVEMVALVDTGASVSVFPYSLYKDLGLGNLRPYQTNLTMVDNIQSKAMGEVKNVRIQIGYQAYVVDLLILDIAVDPELPLLLGRPFLRTCEDIIDMQRGTLCIDDEVIRHTYFPKPRSKSYVESFETEGKDDWLGSFEVGSDEDGNVKYGPVALSFIDIEDDMERTLAMEEYFNPFKNVIAFKKLVDFLGSLPKSRKDTLPNLLNADYERRNKRNTITYSFQPVSNANLKWKDLPSIERHAYYEKLSKLQKRSFGVPRVANWRLFDGYGFEDTLREMMKLEYIYEGYGDLFVDYSWERALSIDDEIYPEWVLEFFSTLYFDKDVDRHNLMKEKCIWFRLCGHEHILTFPEFAVALGLFMKEEVEHRLFEVYFGKLEVDDKQFDHKDYWTRVGKPTLTNHKEVLVKEPLMRIVHKVIMGSLVHRHALGTKENSVICAGHYVTKIAGFLSYYVDEEIKKCSKPTDYDYWTSKMLADELDMDNTCLKKENEMPTQAEEGEGLHVDEEKLYARTFHAHSPSFRGPSFKGSSSGNAVGGSSKGAGFDDDDMDE
ncbi:hypothetical protein Tco_1081656 [Tanacetum coccineum]|uniref:Uncharacterized protein n=1 Tax=Tanacetum coccineum TaxID=301880 RepID=A0ABQ5HY88_9ASTR